MNECNAITDHSHVEFSFVLYSSYITRGFESQQLKTCSSSAVGIWHKQYSFKTRPRVWGYGIKTFV